MDFNIQFKVRVVSYEELPLEARNKAIAKACGKDGEIVDRLYSEAEGGYIYRVHLEGSRTPSTINFTEEMLEPSGGGQRHRGGDGYRGQSRYNPNVPGRRRDSTSSRTHLQRRTRRDSASNLLRSEATLLVV